MRGILAAIPLLLLPVQATAGGNDATVTILTPTAGACVNNGGEVYTGGVLGGMAGPAIQPLAVNVRLTERNGNGRPDPITVRLDVDGVQVFEREYQPVAEGQAFETGTMEVMDISDGLNRRVTVHALVGNNDTTASVVFNIDRQAPAVVPDAELPDSLLCNVNPPAVMYHVEDPFDMTPTVVERFETDGCNVRRVIRVSDDCGNIQEVSALSRRPPPPNPPITLTFGGIAEGARVGSGSVTYDIVAPANCVDSIQSTLTLNGEVIGPVIYGDQLTEAGTYVAQVNISACGAAPISATRRFTILAKPTADAGGPYEVLQNETVRLCASGSISPPELGGIVGYQWDINDDHFYDEHEGRTECIDFGAEVGSGVYTVRVKVQAGNQTFSEDEAIVTVTDVTPECDLDVPPGPFSQGDLVAFDATGSTPGNDFEPVLLYEWHFGDGSPDQLAAGLGTTLHRYESPGDFAYTVIVHDVDSSCTTGGMLHVDGVAPICREVTVFGAESLVEGRAVQFTVDAIAGSASDPITNYTWTYGDSPAPDAGPQNVGPSHTYSDQGEFEINVVVDDSDSQTSCEPVTAVVRDLVPIVELDGPRVLIEGETATFDALETRAEGEADELTLFEWDFGDDTDPVNGPPDVRRQEHLFAENGEFDVRLTASDEDGDASAELHIVVLDVAPISRFTIGYAADRENADEGVPVTLDASSSTAGGVVDPIVNYRWDFGDGETAEGPELETVDHEWPDNGIYAIRLTVVDDDGSEGTSEATIQVLNVAPVARIEVEETVVDVNQPYLYRAVIDDVVGDLASVDWNMGDLTTFENRSEVEHTYRAQGIRTITINVNDGDGGVTTATLDVEVTRGRPRLVLEGPYEGTEGQPLVIEFQVESAETDPGVYDGPVQVPQPQLPPGSTWEETLGANPTASKTIRFSWTPSFVDAGRTTLLLRAQAPSGLSRDRELNISVSDAGTPFAAAAAIVNGEGRVTVIEYGRDPLNHALTLRPTAEVAIGSGVGSLAGSADGRFLFAATPGSGGVAAINMSQDPPAFARLIRTGTDCSAVAASDDRVYAVNSGDDTLSIIDSETLKVVRTVALGPLGRPTDVVYLPAGFADLAAPRLIVVGARGGHVVMLDPAVAERGGANAIVGQRRLGGSLQRVVADAVSGFIHVADAKTRRLYAFNAGAFALDANGAEVTGTPLDFAAQDLAAEDGSVFVASRGGLVEIAGMGAPLVHSDEASRTVAAVSPKVFPGGGLLLIGNQGLEHREHDLSLVLHTSGRPNTRRLTTFVTLH